MANMTGLGKRMASRKCRLIAVLAAIGLASGVPALAQTDDGEPSRNRTSPSPQFQLEPELPPPLPDPAPPEETAGPVPPAPGAAPVLEPVPPVQASKPPPASPPPSVEAPPSVTAPSPGLQNARLLLEGLGLLAAKKLTTPKGNSAIDRFRQVLADDPGNTRAKKGIAEIAATYKSWGLAAFNAKQYAKAEKYLGNSIKIDGRDDVVHGYLGFAQLRQKKYKAALAAFRAALKLRPGEARYYGGIGSAYLRLGKYTDAVKALERATARRTVLAADYRLIAIANERLQDWSAALRAYERAYAIDPKPGEDELALGRLLVKTKAFEKSLSYLNRAAKALPNNPEVFDFLGEANLNLGRLKTALVAYKTARRLKQGEEVSGVPPARIPPLTGIAGARAEFAANRFRAAFSQYKSEARKGDAEAAYMLGRMYHQGIGVRRNLKSAFDWYMTAARAGHPAAQAGVGFMYYRGLGGVRRNYSRAAGWFEKAARGGITGAMARLGDMYEYGKGVRRNTRTGAMWYVKAAQLGNRAARQRLRRLGTASATTFSGVPDEIESGLGELPALMAVTGGTIAAEPAAPARPVRKPVEGGSKDCSGLSGRLGCM